MFPTLPEILNELQFITYEAALLGLFITAGLILIARDWRVLILALLSQYILVGIILSRLVRPDIAVLGVLIGAFICPILFLSARQISVTTFSASLYPTSTSQRGVKLFGRRFSWPSFWRQTDRRPATGVVFRLFVGLMMILIATTLSRSFPLPGLAQSVTTGVYWLAGVGLLTPALTEDPLKVGIGLLTALIGFDLFYATLESSLLLTGLWGAVKLVIALVVGYLVVVKGSSREEAR